MPVVTQIVILATILFLVAYNLVAWFVWGGESTISHQIFLAVSKWPTIGLATGVLIGHWFFPSRGEAPGWWSWLLIAVVLFFVVLDVIYGLGSLMAERWNWFLLYAFFVGGLAGRYFWANSAKNKVDTIGNIG
jgi:hypothetical protein